MENNSGSSAGGYGGNKGGYLKSGSDKYKKDKPFVPQDRVKLSNIEREVSNLKTKLFNIEQYFSQERPGHHFDVLEIFFLDGTREKFTDVNIKKYTRCKNGN